MPLYEEKLISPLAVRFTQEHIRSTFRDNRDVEASREQIETRPGTGDYDLLLSAPFPHIEIIRWAPKGRSHISLKEGSSDDDEEVEYHWFTFDNRRLYCLQRAAVELWPKRVACVVEVVYADPDHSMHRKFDSTTDGMAVNQRHHSNLTPYARWDWRRQVLTNLMEGGDLEAITRASAVLTDDDGKQSMNELLDSAPCKTPLAALLEQNAKPPELELSSTVATSEDEDGEEEAATSEGAKASSAPGTPTSQATRTATGETAIAAKPGTTVSLKDTLRGSWSGPKKETYKIDVSGDSRWNAVRKGPDGAVKHFTLTYDKKWDCVWWGTGGRFFACPPETTVEQESAQQMLALKWYAASDTDMRRPVWTWYKNYEEAPAETKANNSKTWVEPRGRLAQAQTKWAPAAQAQAEKVRWVPRTRGA